MANVFDSGLVVSTISQQVQTVLANRLAPLRLFTSDFSNEVKKAKDTIQVPIVSATAATSVNPTNFEPGSSVTIGKATVTLDHVAQFFGIDQADLALGHRLENLIKINVDALADKLWSLAITPITTVNFGGPRLRPPRSRPAAAIWPPCGARSASPPTRAWLSPPAIYSALIPTNADFLPLQNGAYGFDQGVFYANSFSGAVTDLDGFACSREAVCVASAKPMIDPAVSSQFQISDQVVTLEQLGLSVYWNVWGSTGNRQVNASIELMFGAAPGLTSNTMALII